MESSDVFPPEEGAFADMLVGKRRRNRTVSGGSQPVPPGATLSTAKKPEKKKTKAKKDEKGQVQKEGSCDPNQAKNTTVPIFLKKTYKMIDTCDPKISSWTDDGEMFVVKDPDVFAEKVIPQFFDHNKFSSFARQLNFYGFRKMQAKPIRNADYDVSKAKYVTFYNEKFKRGRCDLLNQIQRSTRGTHAGNAEHQKEVESLRSRISELEQKVEFMNGHFEERLRTVELNMLGQMERMMIALGHQSGLTGIGDVATATTEGVSSQQEMQQTRASLATPSAVTLAMTPTQHWDPIPLRQQQQMYQGQNSMAPLSAHSVQQNHLAPSTSTASGGSGPTLPPHPKQKGLGSLPADMNVSNLPARFPSVSFGRGFSLGPNRALSNESTASAALMKNSWEDKFFHALMLGDNEAATAAQQHMGTGLAAASGPVSDEAMQAAISAAQLSQAQRLQAASLGTVDET